jgi:EAL domain-containing protein (putative c-di-GMP-specific phosphodiesterase class I)
MNHQTHTSPLRVVVIHGEGSEQEHMRQLCRELDLYLVGAVSSGSAGLKLIESLPVPPDLIVVELRLPDMDFADLALALSKLQCGSDLIVYGADCPRLQDTALMLAGTLGLRPCAAISAPMSVEALKSAVEEIDTARRRVVPSLLESSVQASSIDAADIQTGLLHGEFELYYQPKISLSSRRLRGAEALLRWHHPGHGLLSPGSFLRQAEAAGLAELLTMEVLRMALADSRAWREAGFNLPVSINLSPLALSNPELADQVIETVRRAGLPPSSIAFEITEYTEIADLHVALRVLLKLRLNGHRLSLDDYGAGHASILQLSRIPFSEVKIDQRLVQNAWKRPHLRPLLQQAVDTARELGMTSVAEGIETRQDWEFMRSLGCDLAQGYLIAHPMRAMLLPAWRPERSKMAGESDAGKGD